MLKTIRPTSGHILDIDAAEIADQFLSRAYNVNTRKGFPSRIGGRRLAYPLTPSFPVDPYHLQNFTLGSFNWWLCFGTDDIWAVEGNSSYDITPSGGLTSISNPSEWTSVLLNGIPIFSNGKDAPMFWTGNGGDDAASLTDWPAGTIARVVSAINYHIFAFNINNPSGDFENLVLWSAAAEPGTLPDSWTPASDNEAGSLYLSDTPGKIIAARPLGLQLMTYKPTALYAIEYAGQPPDRIYTQRALSRSFGALGPHCVVDRNTKQLIVGNDDVCLTDGVNIVSVADNKIKRYLANSIDELNSENSFVLTDINHRETWVCIPEKGSKFATVAHIWDETHDTWTIRDLNNVRHAVVGYVTDELIDNTWDGHEEPWNEYLSAWNQGSVGSSEHVILAEDTKLYVEDVSEPLAITAGIVKQDMLLDDDTQNKITQRVWIRGSGSGFNNLELRLGARNLPEDSMVWSSFQPVSTEGNDIEVTGKYISIEVRSLGVAEWTITRIIIEARYNGPY